MPNNSIIGGTSTCAANTAASARIDLPNGDELELVLNDSIASVTGAWCKMGYADVVAAVGTGSTLAAATLTSTGVFSPAETVTIGSRTYTFRAALSTGPTIPNEVLIGANQTASHLNLKKAVNGEATAGTEYSTGTVIHPTITALSSDGTHTIFNAKTPGTAGNALVSTETCALASFAAGTFASGADGDETSFYLPPRVVRRLKKDHYTHMAAIGVGANTTVNILGLG